MTDPDWPKLPANEADVDYPGNLADEMAERSLLAAMMQDDAMSLLVQQQLDEKSFSRIGHACIYDAMVRLSEKGATCDSVALANQLQQDGKLRVCGGRAYLESFHDLPYTNARLHLDIVRNLAKARHIIAVAEQSLQSLKTTPRDVEQIARAHIESVEELGKSSADRGLVSVKESMTGFLKHLEDKALDRGDARGLQTGFVDLDAMLCGIRRGSMVVIAGRPGMGKSAIGLNIAQNLALRDNKSVAIFSVEMSRDELMERMLCTQSQVHSQHMATGQFSDLDWKKMLPACSRLAESKICIDDSERLFLVDVRAKARRMKERQGLDLVIIDYLQIMQPGPASARQGREKEIGDLARGIKALAKELDIPIIVMAQLNRESEKRSGGRPILSDLRESGAIEQEAHAVLLVYREDMANNDGEKKGTAEIIVAKNRGGKPGVAHLKYMGEYFKFGNLEKERVDALGLG